MGASVILNWPMKRNILTSLPQHLTLSNPHRKLRKGLTKGERVGSSGQVLSLWLGLLVYLRVGAPWQRFSFDAGDKVSGRQNGHARARCYGGAAEVWGHNQVVELQQRIVWWNGLRGGHVEAGSGYNPGIEAWYRA